MSSLLHADYVRFPNHLEEINRLTEQSPMHLVSHADRRFHESICQVARKISGTGCRVVLLAGPTSSGKTTTAHLLADALRDLEHQTQIISLDDFFYAEEDVPIGEDGQRDFESLEALRVDCIQQCLRDLAESGRCEMPQFDFLQHRPRPELRRLELGGDGIAVIEGLHALNPQLTSQLRRGRVIRLYISVKQDIHNGGETLLSAHEVRMVRRIVRDFNFRETGPEKTLNMWHSVMEGERKYIAPFKRLADFTINSYHAYELGVLRNPALLLLHSVGEQSGWVAEEVRRLVFALMLFRPISPSLLPPTSLIREFIGGGRYA